MTTSSAGLPVASWMSTGMPLPSSVTEQLPSARSAISMFLQRPASASSMELATTSSTRWCSPRAPVSPMYMAGRCAHGLDVAEDADLSGVVALRRGGFFGWGRRQNFRRSRLRFGRDVRFLRVRHRFPVSVSERKKSA